MEPKLIFTMDLPESSHRHLVVGNLALDYGSSVINYLATSGAPGRQTKHWFWQQGGLGPIPEGEYSIPTVGYLLSNPGINGLFFHITPDPISAEGRRSELGIHLDANYEKSPGTAGCIGIIRRSGFDRFCDRLLKLNRQGVKKLPLEVRYY